MAKAATSPAPGARQSEWGGAEPVPTLPRVLAALLDGKVTAYAFDDATADRMLAVQFGIAHAAAMDCLRRTTPGAGGPAGAACLVDGPDSGSAGRPVELGGATRLMNAGARLMDARQRLRRTRATAAAARPRIGPDSPTAERPPLRVMWLHGAGRESGPRRPAPPRPIACGARTRSGAPCRAAAAAGRTRCRMHGGAAGSGAPRGNRNARTHGRHGGAALDRQCAIRKHWRDATATAALIERLCRLDPGAGAEIRLVLGRGGPDVPLFLRRDGRGRCHLSRPRPDAAAGERMGLIREKGEAAQAASFRAHGPGQAPAGVKIRPDGEKGLSSRASAARTRDPWRLAHGHSMLKAAWIPGSPALRACARDDTDLIGRLLGTTGICPVSRGIAPGLRKDDPVGTATVDFSHGVVPRKRRRRSHLTRNYGDTILAEEIDSARPYPIVSP